MSGVGGTDASGTTGLSIFNKFEPLKQRASVLTKLEISLNPHLRPLSYSTSATLPGKALHNSKAEPWTQIAPAASIPNLAGIKPPWLD